MKNDLYLAFALYNQKMNEKLFKATGRLSDTEMYADRGAFFKSVYSTLEHIMLADIVWLRRFQSIPELKEVLTPLKDYPEIKPNSDRLFNNLNELFKQRQKLDQLIHEFCRHLTEPVLSVTFKYKNMAGQDFENLVWVCVSHFFNHQTHHRGQATTLLTQQGVDVGVTDFVAVIREP